jgi:hypothetical protein
MYEGQLNEKFLWNVQDREVRHLGSSRELWKFVIQTDVINNFIQILQ